MLSLCSAIESLNPSPTNHIIAPMRYPIVAFIRLPVFPVLAAADDPPLLTVAEKSDYKATSRHADVLDFCERLAKQAPLVRLDTLGISAEGRALPMLILADPPIATAEEA